MGLFGFLQVDRHYRPEPISPRQALDEIARREHVHFSALILNCRFNPYGFTGFRKALPHLTLGGTGRDIAGLLAREAFTVEVKPSQDMVTYPGLERFNGNLLVRRLVDRSTLNFFMDAEEGGGAGRIIRYGYTVIDYGELRPCCNGARMLV